MCFSVLKLCTVFVRFRMAVGDQLANRVFREGFPFLNIVEIKAKAHFLKDKIARKSFTHC